MLSEFEIISHYFTPLYASTDKTKLTVGDDCALLHPTCNMQLAISTDILVEGKHFFPQTDPTTLGYKCLAVNLSDLAAMGAKPMFFTLALVLPEANSIWLSQFSQGLLGLADEYNCKLIGGDTTKGPLTISITIFGEVPSGQALYRNAAKNGDDIWISGTIGDARLALAVYRNELILDLNIYKDIALRMHKPIPRVALGIALRGIAHAAIDVSDGLTGDLAHILKLSQVGARIYIDTLPISSILQQQSLEICRNFALSGGDDYELCFTAPTRLRQNVLLAAAHTKTTVTRIGIIEKSPGLRLVDINEKLIDITINSFDHFITS